MVLCPCQASHSEQSLSGSAGCEDRVVKLHIKKMTGHLFRGCCALMSCGFAPGVDSEHTQDLTKYPLSPSWFNFSLKCIQAHACTLGGVGWRRSDIPEPKLPMEYNFICKQHNWFMTLQHVCPSFLLCFTPVRRFCLGNNVQQAFHKY